MRCSCAIFAIKRSSKLSVSPVIQTLWKAYRRQLSVLLAVESLGGEIMKKLLLIALVAGGLMFTAAPRSDAGVSVGIGFGFHVAYPYQYYYLFTYLFYGSLLTR